MTTASNTGEKEAHWAWRTHWNAQCATVASDRPVGRLAANTETAPEALVISA